MAPENRKRVLVAMSGGVDSSVAAYLLKKQGYEVIGITFQLYDYSRQNRKEGKGGCCSLEDIDDAKSVCAKLGIRHYLMDNRKEFQSRVIDYFASTYKAGGTPNPCVACNTFIKFDELAYYADSVGADLYATGHYVRITHSNDGVPLLQQAKELSKDQSYFLVGVSPEKLKRCLFPVGEFSKAEVRALALEAGLCVSEKKESMEVCFIPENNYRKFLKENYSMADDPGEFVSETGEVLGRHPGIHYFTVGQRKGLAAFGLSEYYVVRTEADTKRVVVGMDLSLYSEGLSLDPQFFRDPKAVVGQTLKVKIRSRADSIPADIVAFDGQELTIRFHKPQRAVTKGQFAVFYDETFVVGGGPISKAVAKFLSNVA